MSFTQAFNDSRNRAMAWDAAAAANAKANKLSQAFAAIRERDAVIERLTEALRIQEAMTAGVAAQTEALKEVHPTSPLLAPSGKVFADPPSRGNVKSKLRLIYEQVFDATALKAGIKNPASHRKN